MAKTTDKGTSTEGIAPAEVVVSTSCNTRSQSRLVHTKHGTVKVVKSVPVKDKS